MSHFAKVENGVVTNVIVAEQDFIDSGAVGDPASWIQTSYNTIGGEHRNNGTPLRMNYAGIGYLYDADLDAFIPPKPFPSWVLNREKAIWEAPIQSPEPDTGKYIWDEEEQQWVEAPDIFPKSPIEDTTQNTFLG